MPIYNGGKPGKHTALKVFFWLAVLILILSFIFTIIGSAVNLEVLLNVGIICWLVTTFLFFAWLVIAVLIRTKRYKKQEKLDAG